MFLSPACRYVHTGKVLSKMSLERRLCSKRLNTGQWPQNTRKLRESDPEKNNLPDRDLLTPLVLCPEFCFLKSFCGICSHLIGYQFTEQELCNHFNVRLREQ